MKSIFASKTFWFNVLTAGAGFLGSGSLPSKWALPVAGIINIILRAVTSQPVSILPQ